MHAALAVARGAAYEVHCPEGGEGDDGAAAGVGILRAVDVAIVVVTLTNGVHAVARIV